MTIGVVCWLLTLNVSGMEGNSMFDRANELYVKGRYDSAITIYKDILSEGHESGAIYYNLGNAYYHKRDIANAILFYEKAVKLAPNDEDIIFNLKLANLKISDKIEPLPQMYVVRKWKSLIQMSNSYGWSVVFLIAVWTAFLAGVSVLLSPNIRVKRASFFLGVFLLLICCCTLIFSNSRYKIEEDDRYAILFSPSAYVKSAPDESSKDLFIIHEGIKIKIVYEVGEWNKIRLADGKQGWLEKKDLERI